MGVSLFHRQSSIQEKVYLGGPGDVTMGKACRINERSFLQGARLGSYVMIAPDVKLLANMHRTDRTDVPMLCQGSDTDNPVEIGDDVWIGRNVIVMPGVKIGSGAVIGAGAVVTHNIEDFAVAVGVPAKVIRYRNG